VLGFQSARAVQAHVEVVQAGTNFTYTVFNDEAAGSSMYLDAFHLEARAPFDVVSSPPGRVFETDHFTYIDWVCTNDVLPYPQEVAPGGTLTGFILRSKVAASEPHGYAVTSWNNTSDASGPVSRGKVAAPALLGFDASLTNVLYSTSNTFNFALNGVPTFSYAIQSSSNLTTWSYVATNSAPFTFADTNAAKAPRRFYKPVFVPDAASWPVLGN
jgi:hypothetical protein